MINSKSYLYVPGAELWETENWVQFWKAADQSCHQMRSMSINWKFFMLKKNVC